MKKVLILLLGVFLSIILIKCAKNRNEETLPIIKTTNIKCYSQDSVAIEYKIKYKGENYTDFIINRIARQITSREHILKNNNIIKILMDSLKNRIIPTDSTFNIVLITAIYHLPDEIIYEE